MAIIIFFVLDVIAFIITMCLATAFGSFASYGRNRYPKPYEDQIIHDYQEQQRRLR